MNDLHSALAAERSRALLAQARYDGLARLARCCTPTGAARGTAHGIAQVRAAGRATLHWLRKGQLGGYPVTCR